MKTFGTGQGFLKAGFLGFNKSGKTYTATLLAVELRKRLKLKGPVAIFDTEASAEYVAPMILQATGINPIGEKSRSMVDLVKMAQECEAGAAPILIVDSITHVWREVCDAYLKQLNEARDQSNKPRRNRLEFQDWNAIKQKWAEWVDFYLNSQLHIIICGRAGFEWAFETTENSDGSERKELVKTGIKMKVESEFGFEPSLLVEMERIQEPDPARAGRFTIKHRATVIGDRFDAMDGKSVENPAGDWFAPHLDMLTPGASNVVDVTPKTPMGVDDAGQTEWDRERKGRVKLCEEIEGEIVKAYPGQSKEEKRAKVVLLEACLGTKSWTAVQGMNSGELRAGLDRVRVELSKVAPVAAGKDGE